MPRETFPFEAHRHVVREFMAGRPDSSEDELCRTASNDDGSTGWLIVGHANTAAASFAEDGALLGYLDLKQVDLHYAVKVQNYMLEVLGDPRRITMKPVVRSVMFAGQSVDQTMAPHLDDVEIPINQPWVIAGRLTMLAWRAEYDRITTVVEIDDV